MIDPHEPALDCDELGRWPPAAVVQLGRWIGSGIRALCQVLGQGRAEHHLHREMVRACVLAGSLD